MKRVVFVAPVFLLVAACGSGHANAPSAEALLVSYDQAPSAVPYVTALDAVAPRCTESRTDLAYAVESGRQQLAKNGYEGTDLAVLRQLNTSLPAAGQTSCTSQLVSMEVNYQRGG